MCARPWRLFWEWSRSDIHWQREGKRRSSSPSLLSSPPRNWLGSSAKLPRHVWDTQWASTGQRANATNTQGCRSRHWLSGQRSECSPSTASTCLKAHCYRSQCTSCTVPQRMGQCRQTTHRSEEGFDPCGRPSARRTGWGRAFLAHSVCGHLSRLHSSPAILWLLRE